MLTRLDLEHFKCFELLKLPLSQLTLLTGANATGKSSVMQSLVLMHQTIREHEWSSKLMLNGDELSLGTVTDVIDKISGRVSYAVMSFGGFIGLGHSHYPLPWGALKYNTKLNGFETAVTEAQLKDAPAFSDDSWTDRSWETKTHTHYNIRPYW